MAKDKKKKQQGIKVGKPRAEGGTGNAFVREREQRTEREETNAAATAALAKTRSPWEQAVTLTIAPAQLPTVVACRDTATKAAATAAVAAQP